MLLATRTPPPRPAQEFFLVPREAYYKRTDLQLSGRTVMGMDAPRGQELSDHYKP